MLTGKYRRGEEAPTGTRLAGGSTRFGAWLTDANHDRVEALEKVAAERGHGVGDLALAWLAAHDVVCSVIAGATSPEQVRANAAGLEWRLDASDLAAVETALANVRG
jgi:aryl-alcohol dehydrogenase-like predicted oxidoreductase